MQDNHAHVAAEPRTTFGKKVRFLRRQGILPANIFGNGVESRAIQLNTREIDHLLTHTPRNALLSIDVAGAPVTAIIKQVERRPTTSELYHIDFYQVSMTHTLRMAVPLVLTGESPAVKLANATLLHAMDSVEVECLPGNLPTQITVDVEKLREIDAAIYVRDLDVPKDVTILTPEDELVVKALAPTVAEAGEEVEGEEATPTVAEAEEEKQPESESEEAKEES